MRCKGTVFFSFLQMFHPLFSSIPKCYRIIYNVVLNFFEKLKKRSKAKAEIPTLAKRSNSFTSYGNITLFAQTIGKLPKENIRKANTDKHCKGYNTWSQLISMVFCQFSDCDISNGLNSANGNLNLNHLGINRAQSKSTVAYQNEHRDSKVFRSIFFEFGYFGQQQCLFRGKAQGQPALFAGKGA